jgi:hypothetical protein
MRDTSRPPRIRRDHDTKLPLGDLLINWMRDHWGIRVTEKTLNRWATRGIRGRRLQVVRERTPGRPYVTTKEWANEFLCYLDNLGRLQRYRVE